MNNVLSANPTPTNFELSSKCNLTKNPILKRKQMVGLKVGEAGVGGGGEGGENIETKTVSQTVKRGKRKKTRTIYTM